MPPRSSSSLSCPRRVDPPAARMRTEGDPTLTDMVGSYRRLRSSPPHLFPFRRISSSWRETPVDLIRDVAEIVGGSAEKLRKVSLFETARFFTDVYVLVPGQAQASHVHAASDKVYVVLSGTGTIRV